MMMVKAVLFSVLLTCSWQAVALQPEMQVEKRAAEYVNPFIGASTNVRDAGAYHGLPEVIMVRATVTSMKVSKVLPLRR